MEDKRIQKTKFKLRQGLTNSLAKKTFEQLSVTELCKEANVSRITFYTYYDDKYDLVEDFFSHMLQEVMNDLEQRQNENNPEDDSVKAYCNMLDAVLDLHEQYDALFRNATLQENNYLFYSYYQFALKQVEKFAARYIKELKPNYPLNQVTSFLCNGIWGFVHSATTAGRTREDIRPEAICLLTNILESHIFVESDMKWDDNMRKEGN